MQDITNQEFDMLRDYIKKNFGINLGDEKRSMVFSRLRVILQEQGLTNFTDYYKYLTSDKSGEAVTRFIDRITTNHTFFMRETDHFDYFRDTVLPYIKETYAAEKDLRLWCAGSSSGEEPYTLMMIIQDFFKDSDNWNIEILATDISTTVLDKAVRGIYSKESVATLPEDWQKNYFTDYDGANRVVTDRLKKLITYRKFNLMNEHFPFRRKFQVIFCRNVMIYFDTPTRDALVERFHKFTENGGWLFIGHSESLNQSTTPYKYLMPATYRK
ncbi:MAG: protein-glutamate O-methyltransferase CheR [Clostridiales bacterium]|jgi:chemotaxis protein methyltransferase CheR|nr:protein-glutamate O-methyltransferase CheR [Clostridiales bacterium]